MGFPQYNETYANVGGERLASMFVPTKFQFSHVGKSDIIVIDCTQTEDDDDAGDTWRNLSTRDPG
jgi:hypothetical protein